MEHSKTQRKRWICRTLLRETLAEPKKKRPDGASQALLSLGLDGVSSDAVGDLRLILKACTTSETQVVERWLSQAIVAKTFERIVGEPACDAEVLSVITEALLASAISTEKMCKVLLHSRCRPALALAIISFVEKHVEMMALEEILEILQTAFSSSAVLEDADALLATMAACNRLESARLVDKTRLFDDDTTDRVWHSPARSAGVRDGLVGLPVPGAWALVHDGPHWGDPEDTELVWKMAGPRDLVAASLRRAVIQRFGPDGAFPSDRMLPFIELVVDNVRTAQGHVHLSGSYRGSLLEILGRALAYSTSVQASEDFLSVDALESFAASIQERVLELLELPGFVDDEVVGRLARSVDAAVRIWSITAVVPHAQDAPSLATLSPVRQGL